MRGVGSRTIDTVVVDVCSAFASSPDRDRGEGDVVSDGRSRPPRRGGRVEWTLGPRGHRVVAAAALRRLLKWWCGATRPDRPRRRDVVCGVEIERVKGGRVWASFLLWVFVKRRWRVVLFGVLVGARRARCGDEEMGCR